MQSSEIVTRVEEEAMRLKKIKALLGAPFYEAPDVLLYHLDCLEGLRRLDDALINLTVTSPPYNIGKAYETPLPLHDYLHWCETWIGEIHRVTKADGAFWLNLGYLEIPEKARAIPIPYLLWDRIPFYLMQEVVWNYRAGVHTKRMFSPRNEKFLWYVKSPGSYVFHLDAVRDPNVKYPNQKKNGKLKCNPLGKNPSDVWEIPKVTSGESRSSKERTAHPAQFPLAVIDRIIKACSSEGDVVLDPFIGSGTTAIAALANGRQVIGFDLSPAYCQIASNRIARFLEERDIAVLPPPSAESRVFIRQRA
jgi:adenine-specific DNA-methyltransferase